MSVCLPVWVQGGWGFVKSRTPISNGVHQNFHIGSSVQCLALGQGERFGGLPYTISALINSDYSSHGFQNLFRYALASNVLWGLSLEMPREGTLLETVAVVIP